MHILLIGGSGQTGSLVIEEALRRGHTVTALVRNPTSITEKEGLTIIKGTPLQRPDVETAFTAASPSIPTAVIVTLASNRTSGSPWATPSAPARLMADSHANIFSAMRAHSVRKIATASSLGVGSSLTNLTCLMRWVIRHSNLCFSYADHDLVDEEMRSPDRSDVEYVLVRSARLTNGPRAPLVFYGDEGVGVGALSAVSRASVAAFLVDAVERDTWDRTTPVISN